MVDWWMFSGVQNSKGGAKRGSKQQPKQWQYELKKQLE
jgi:hypothetical protein